MPIPSPRSILTRVKRSSPSPSITFPPQRISSTASSTMPARVPESSVLVSDPPSFMVASSNGNAVSDVVNGITPEVSSNKISLPQRLTLALQQPQVQMRDGVRTALKLQKMIAGGPEKLLVVSDFDHTLSRAYDEKGERCWTTHGVFDNATVMPEVAKICRELSAKYYPIEFDGKMSIAEKIPHMEAWWRLSHDAIVQQRVKKEQMEELVAECGIRLRCEATHLLKQLEHSKVPLVLFSAGIGDIISVFLQQRLGAVPSNMHIISNMMKFNQKNEAIGFSEPLIHTFNKNGSVIQKDATLMTDEEAGFFHEMRRRDNVILLGDSMGDLHMDVGVENHKEEDTLKIAFLNKKPHLLEYYLDGYDIVIVDDQTMLVPNAIVDCIAGRAGIQS